MSKVHSLYERFPYILPVGSALILIVTLPPFNLWLLVFVALVPMYLFTFQEQNIHRVFAGALFLGLLFSGYLFFITLSSFSWIPEAHLFSTLVKLLAIPVVLFASVATALSVYLLKMSYLFKTESEIPPTPLQRAILFGVFAVAEWLVGKVFMGFNYGSLAYAATHIPALRFMASIGGTFLVTFVVVFGNAAIAEALRFLFQRKNRDVPLLIPLGIFAAIIGISLLYQRIVPVASLTTSPSISIAIIQDPTHKESEAFGTIAQGSFQFPLLEKYVAEAVVLHPDIIIYPFSPWTGVLANTLDNRRFTKNIIGMDFAIFGKWLAIHVPPETTLVTWDTRLEGGKYWGEIDFWKNGALVGSYRKKTLFPFMDYTPQWSGQLGVYSLPYDGTEGTSTSPVIIGKAVIGNLVCSEVALPESAQENSGAVDVVFAIGSEAMFSSPLASEFNLLNAQLRATESGRVTIRANKFGPSALIDTYGNIIKGLPRNQSGILFVETPVQTDHKMTLYSSITEYPFLILLMGYALFLLTKSSRKSF